MIDHTGVMRAMELDLVAVYRKYGIFPKRMLVVGHTRDQMRVELELEPGPQ